MQNITFVGVAAALDISHMALYKYVPSLEALKCLVAEEIFSRWQTPEAIKGKQDGLKDYLLVFTESIREFVKAHPGLTPYIICKTAATLPMLNKINDHQSHIAQVYGIQQRQARWLLSTVAFHCFSVADTVYTVARQGSAADALSMEHELIQGIEALIVGALVMLKDDTYLDRDKEESST